MGVLSQVIVIFTVEFLESRSFADKVRSMHSESSISTQRKKETQKITRSYTGKTPGAEKYAAVHS